MGERRPNHTASDRGYASKREDAPLDDSVIVPRGRYTDEQTPALEQETKLESPVRTSQRVEFWQSNERTDPECARGKIIFDYVEENKRLQEHLNKVLEANAALNAKVTSLIEENRELWGENTRLNDALKELQELKEKEERRKELQRQRAAKWRKDHPETHRARAHKPRRDDSRSDEEQQAESA